MSSRLSEAHGEISPLTPFGRGISPPCVLLHRIEARAITIVTEVPMPYNQSAGVAPMQVFEQSP